jgi:hypothetical protein
VDTTAGHVDPRVSAVAVEVRFGLLWSGLVPFGYNRLLWAVSPFISDESDHPGPIGREEEDVTLPGMRQMWYEVIRTTSLHT